MDSSLLSAHLEQIQACCHGIDSLPFPPPRIFTNAMLSNHDITSLIRDTEAHERALFSVPPPPPTAKPSKPSTEEGAGGGGGESSKPRSNANRRQTVFNVASGEVTTGPTTTRGGGAAAPHRRTAVAAVLGGEMHEQLRRGETDRKGDLDVEVLLRGAEKLCGVYELPGARERIAALRARFRHGRDTTAYYEARVAEQAEQLAGMNNKGWMGQHGEHQDGEEAGEAGGGGDEWTEEDLRREEEEARLMERKKRELQARLRSMEKDLGGLRNM
ncbi:DASH complex, subunit Spc34 [Trichoderma citrinoviride]|uniref:DASH complex subunit SPC34 n=1 Tax=Trichoderma citrinoviride TaxID=58853 RepID=A0A2T4AXW2_9HYPO|nr:DASH complex, subunit Spc34 [Trichoderma citrinoviride]PTB61915.1 DASH complex, subunit Spc34 [Trichoderma citrinoviride]